MPRYGIFTNTTRELIDIANSWEEALTKLGKNRYSKKIGDDVQLPLPTEKEEPTQIVTPQPTPTPSQEEGRMITSLFGDISITIKEIDKNNWEVI